MAYYKHSTRKQRLAFADDVRRLGLPIDERYPERFLGGFVGRETRRQKRRWRIGQLLPLGKAARKRRAEEEARSIP